jgi:hypothetical protein
VQSYMILPPPETGHRRDWISGLSGSRANR